MDWLVRKDQLKNNLHGLIFLFIKKIKRISSQMANKDMKENIKRAYPARNEFYFQMNFENKP